MVRVYWILVWGKGMRYCGTCVLGSCVGCGNEVLWYVCTGVLCGVRERGMVLWYVCTGVLCGVRE